MTKTNPMTEATLKLHVKRILTAAGAWYCMPVGGRFGRAGVPDIVGCYHSQLFTLELKTEKGRLTELQAEALQAVRAAGGRAYVIRPSDLDMVAGLFPRHE